MLNDVIGEVDVCMNWLGLRLAKVINFHKCYVTRRTGLKQIDSTYLSIQSKFFNYYRCGTIKNTRKNEK